MWWSLAVLWAERIFTAVFWPIFLVIKAKQNQRNCCFVYVIAWARGQLRINFTHIFKVFTKLPESRSDEGNLENFENASEINP